MNLTYSLWCGFLSFLKTSYQINFSLIVLLTNSVLSLLTHTKPHYTLARLTFSIFILFTFLFSIFAHSSMVYFPRSVCFRCHKLSLGIPNKKILPCSFEKKIETFLWHSSPSEILISDSIQNCIWGKGNVSMSLHECLFAPEVFVLSSLKVPEFRRHSGSRET